MEKVVTEPQLIYETIVTTRRADGAAHVVPLGIRTEGEFIVLAPFRPSATLDNVLRERCAVVNFTDDVQILPVSHWAIQLADLTRCKGGLSAVRRLSLRSELELASVGENEQRPRLLCRVVATENHAPFRGYNRAQAAVLEACILVSRLHMLPEKKIRNEIDYLTIAIGKTAGPREQQAWSWLMEKIDAFFAARPGEIR
jgi:hypothetical protein